MAAKIFQFWVDCFTIGATFGNGVFGIVEIVCAFVWVFYRKKDEPDEARSGREEKVRSVGKWCFIGVFVFSTLIVAPYLKFQEKEDEANKSEKLAEGLASTNSFLSGQIDGEKTAIQTLQTELVNERRDAETASLNSKTDLNEANRQRDVALQRLDYFESNPEKLSEIYSNIFAHTPTNFQQVDSMFAQFNGAISNLTQIETETKKIEENADQSGLESNQLADLGIEKLPDGRTKFGAVVTGQPKIIMDAINAGIRNGRNNDFSAALTNFQAAIAAYESTQPSGVMIDTSSNLTTSGKAFLYGSAGDIAMLVGDNSLAIKYGKKGVEYANQAAIEHPNIETRHTLICSLGDLGEACIKDNDFTDSFKYFNSAVTNFESYSSNDMILDKTNILSLYSTAAFAAEHIGKSGEAMRFQSNFAAILTGVTRPPQKTP